MLREVWNKFNVSLIMILPIFWRITENVGWSEEHRIKYPIHQLALERGLINTCIYNNGKFDGNLYLVFDKHIFFSEMITTDSRYSSLCELLIDCMYFNGIETRGNSVLVALEVPVMYHNDIETICKGAYKGVSDSYKRDLYLRGRAVNAPIGTNPYGNYITANDLGYAISIRAIHIKDLLEDAIGPVNVDDSDNLYTLLNSEREDILNIAVT